jgi:hypothetical protein
MRECVLTGTGKKINVYKVFVWKPEGKMPLGRPRRRCENIQITLKETGWKGVQWIHLAQDRNQRRALANMIMSLRAPQNIANLLTKR